MRKENRQSKPKQTAIYMRFPTLEAYYQSFGIPMKMPDSVPAGKRVWLYSRTAAPNINANLTLGLQHGQIGQHAEQMGYGVIGLSEDCAGGCEMPRPGLAEMQKAAAEHRFDILFVSSSSRLGRDIVQTAELLRELKTQGIKVFSVKEGMWLTEDPMLDIVLDAHWTPLETESGFTQNM